MIVYNLTIHVEHSIQEAWLRWQREEHIPAIMATRQFKEYRFFHLLEQDESEGTTFVIQFIAPTADHYKKYIEEFAPFLRNQSHDKWGNRQVVFRTIMEVMH